VQNLDLDARGGLEWRILRLACIRLARVVERSVQRRGRCGAVGVVGALQRSVLALGGASRRGARATAPVWGGVLAMTPMWRFSQHADPASDARDPRTRGREINHPTAVSF
jgi:hypothetical protein